MIRNGTILTAVECSSRFATISFTLTAQPSFTLGWHMVTFHKLTITTGRGELPLLHVSKTSCYFRWIFLRNDHSGSIVCQDHSESLTQKNTWSNDTSDIIMHCLYVWFFRTRRNEWCWRKPNIRTVDIGFVVVARAGRLPFKSVSIGLSTPLCVYFVHPHTAMSHLPNSNLPASVGCFVLDFVVIRCFTISGFACCAPH
jgi:hypothetical protein